MKTFVTFPKATRWFFTVSLAVLIAQGTGAQAQVPDAAIGSASAGRVDEHFEDQNIIPQVSPQVEVRNVSLQQPPAGAENINLTLNSIEMTGVTAYSPGQLQGVYANKVGQTITLADVYGIASALTTKYRNDGYILTQVVVPPQTIEGGNVKLQVVEGYVDTVTVEGQDQENALKLIRQYAGRIRDGHALNVRTLERWLLIINDLPGVEARSILSPSPSQAGGADLRVITSRDPYDALLAIDNYGSRYLGPMQVSAAASANSFFGNNEMITGQSVVAPQFNDTFELFYFAAAYQQPVGTLGTKAIVNFSNTNTEPGYDLSPFEVHGRSQSFSAKLRHPFIRTRNENLYGHVLFDWRDVDSKNNLEATREDRIRALRAGGRYEFLDTVLGVGINSIDLELAQGVDVFGSSDDGDANLTRPLADTDFTKLNAEIQRLQRVTSKVNLLGVLRGQWSADPLLSSEEFGIGGINIGRGYDPSEIVGDDGVAAKLEVQWNKPYQWDFVQNYQLFAFYDIGKVWQQDATASIDKVNSLASAGFGLRMDFMQQTEADLGVAYPLTRDVETNGPDPRVYFNLSRRF